MTDTIEERGASCMSGWIAVTALLLLATGVAWALLAPMLMHGGEPLVPSVVAVPVLFVLFFMLFKGFVVLDPNHAVVLMFFGKYAGSLRTAGFFWVNPLYSKRRISLRAHNLNTPTLKVNDRAGNPIEVAAVIVWRVYDTARAVFDVENYVAYVTMQSESAVRQVVSARWYDGDEAGAESLRGDLEAVARLLSESIQSHCALAGLEIVEARISHLAYAAEIASAMLRRQQAVAVVAARTQIVDGAVGMVRLALERLENENVVIFTDADRVRLVTNLMTVLVSDSDAQPMLSVDHT